MSKILVLPGDGIGKEIIAQALKVINRLNDEFNLDMELIKGLIGGAAYDETGSPLPQETINLAHDCDSILLGAVGGYEWESLERDLKWAQPFNHAQKYSYMIVFVNFPRDCGYGIKP